MKKLKSEDLPFVRGCNKLRVITGCIKACLKILFKGVFLGRFIMDAGLLSEKQQMRRFLFYRKDLVTLERESVFL